MNETVSSEHEGIVGLMIHFAITLTAKVLMTCDRAIPRSERRQKLPASVGAKEIGRKKV
jgi:hypothetical protein